MRLSHIVSTVFTRFDEAKNSFDCVSLLEGHLREVTGLLLVNESSYLWSSSADHTIRVWEMSSGKCVGVLSNATGQGHNDVRSNSHYPSAYTSKSYSCMFLEGGDLFGANRGDFANAT